MSRTAHALTRKAAREEFRPGFSGDLASMSLPEIVQTLNLGVKTARISIESDLRSGKMWFGGGSLRDASTNRLRGEDAFFEMLTWSTGSFVVEDGIQPKKQTITRDATFLLLEGFRQQDEMVATAEGTAEAPVEQVAVEEPGSHRRWIFTSLALSLCVLAAGIGWVVRSGPAEVAVPVQKQPIVIVAEYEFQGLETTDKPDPVLIAESDPAGSLPTAMVLEPNTDVAFESTPNPTESFGLNNLLFTWFYESDAADPFLPAADLRLIGQSRIKAGVLTVFLDGEQIFSREFVPKHGKAKRFFRKVTGRGAESFEITLPVTSGEHDVLARLERPGDSISYESSLTVTFEPETIQDLMVSVGGLVGPPLRLEPAAIQEPEQQESL